jgi:hypothetical protein
MILSVTREGAGKAGAGFGLAARPLNPSAAGPGFAPA